MKSRSRRKGLTLTRTGFTSRLSLLAVVCVLAMSGCAATPEPSPAANGPSVMIRNEGYSLLYSLAGKQKDVGKLLLVKQASPPVAEQIKEIERTFTQAYEQLNAFAQQDTRMKFGVTHLPVAEQKTRDSIESETARTLLLSTGREFDTQLLLSQTKALQYAAHLARTIDAYEDSKNRKEFLAAFVKQCDGALTKTTQLVGKP